MNAGFHRLTTRTLIYLFDEFRFRDISFSDEVNRHFALLARLICFKAFTVKLEHQCARRNNMYTD